MPTDAAIGASNLRIYELLIWIYQFTFGGCPHSRLSRVFTINQREYKVRCDCGEEFEYSWIKEGPELPRALRAPQGLKDWSKSPRLGHGSHP